jgi:hypothetical protein
MWANALIRCTVYDILSSMEQLLDKLSWPVVIILCLSLGLAPFFPPHIVEKLTMLAKGQLKRPIDWFDLLLHSTPWIILVLKLISGKK